MAIVRLGAGNGKLPTGADVDTAVCRKHKSRAIGIGDGIHVTATLGNLFGAKYCIRSFAALANAKSKGVFVHGVVVVQKLACNDGQNIYVQHLARVCRRRQSAVIRRAAPKQINAIETAQFSCRQPYAAALDVIVFGKSYFIGDFKYFRQHHFVVGRRDTRFVGDKELRLANIAVKTSHFYALAHHANGIVGRHAHFVRPRGQAPNVGADIFAVCRHADNKRTVALDKVQVVVVRSLHHNGKGALQSICHIKQRRHHVAVVYAFQQVCDHFAVGIRAKRNFAAVRQLGFELLPIVYHSVVYYGKVAAVGHKRVCVACFHSAVCCPPRMPDTVGYMFKFRAYVC